MASTQVGQAVLISRGATEMKTIKPIVLLERGCLPPRSKLPYQLAATIALLKTPKQIQPAQWLG